MKYYNLKVAGLERKLPIIDLGDISIASFVLLGDTELVVRSAKLLVKLLPPNIDYIIVPEVKGIPLAFELSKLINKNYIVVRKSVKVYMNEYIETEIKSITTANPQKLYLPIEDVDKIKGKNCFIIDDVISTSATIKGVESIINKAGGHIVGRGCILVEGEAISREGEAINLDSIIHLEKLPLFKKEGDNYVSI